MSRGRRAPEQRDQEPSAFSAILRSLCEVTGSAAAVLVDAEGETVDYAAAVEPYQARIVAAECQLLLRGLERSSVEGFSPPRELMVRARRFSFAAFALAEGYCVVMLLPRRCFRVSRRAVLEAARGVCEEAELPLPPHLRDKEQWALVRVRTGRRDFRPTAVWHQGAWQAVTVLGRFQAADLNRRELGFRAQLESGAELNLVREPLGRWYADES
jgi:hypothetical protein